MTRVDTRSSRTVSIKSSPKTANFGRFLSIIALTIFVSVVYFVIKISSDSLGDPSDQFVVKSIPDIYSRYEGIDPEERDVFEGFRTSFLPAEEVILSKAQSKNKREVYDLNLTNDNFFWGSYETQRETSRRLKRRSQADSQESDVENETDEEYDIQATTDQYGDEDDDDETIKSIVPQQTHVDRGPLEDVVEQVRGQPELEEEEMGVSAHVYKPVKSYTGIHAFWKGQGDRETIRSTQSNIMRQYMDAEADPCHDFYQYACGNWAALNPIPADKAGSDTFEMLRENLDTVLKELLEFKPNEDVRSVYPGSNLDPHYTFVDCTDNSEEEKTFNHRDQVFDTDTQTKMITNGTINEYRYIVNTQNENTEIVKRLRRYLNSKSKTTLKPLSKDIIKNHSKKVKVKQKKQSHSDRELRKRTSNFKLDEPRHLRLQRKLQTFNRLSKRRDKRALMLKKVERTQGIIKNNEPANHDAVLKARFLFKSCMNYDILKKRGHQPLIDLLDLLGGWPLLNPYWNSSNFDWLELMAKLRLFNNDILISEWVGPDIKNSDEFVIQFDQASLGLPTRDYFLQEANKAYLKAYEKYLTTVALLLGGERKHVKENVDQLLNFEIKLAKITSGPEDRKNVSELYRRMTLKKLEELVPQVEWRRYLCIVMNRTVHSGETVVLFALSYVRHLVQLIEETDPSTLSNYLLWRFVRHRINNLDDRFQSAKQQFYFTLFGREEAPSRWKNCVSQVNSNMGMALGSMFVKKYFDEMSKNDTLTMTREIQLSFKELLHLTDWIDEKTKKLAAHKVDAMLLRIGYPDFILNKNELDDRYKEVTVHPDKYFENILNILQHLTKMEQSRIGQPVNKTLWNTAPAVVNAYYSRNKNQIMFPAGILQPPFYHRHFPRSLNYGGIGVVIGHEITHGFDDKGRLFDCDGNLHRWWSDSAIESFHSRAQCLIDQYSHYVVPEVNMKLDGVNTQGENIADNGGVKQAFRAYLRWVKRHGTDGETLPGLNHTHTQLFFLNFAQVWCGAMRPEAIRSKLKTAVHSPGRFRVIGTLSNSHDFAREFNCPPGSLMNPKQKCTVW
uniref:Neprilysin-4-like n=1 Tax=Bombyx mori TaxID=7091 RepID=A0A8R2R416_BOMMO|nr:neprilysin-4 isoform X2 [Bombyx mori]